MEIIVVIVILAVLLAVAVPSVLSYLNEADNAKLMANARAVMNTAQAEVVKQSVSTDGITADELKLMKNTFATEGSIANLSGVDCTVTELYTGEIKVSKEGTTAMAVQADATPITANTDTDKEHRELSAVAMTIDGTPIIAVINDKIYVGAK
ncbi:MAG: hypothetical protein ACLUVC_09645 [Longibaculum sp.]